MHVTVHFYLSHCYSIAWGRRDEWLFTGCRVRLRDISLCARETILHNIITCGWSYFMILLHIVLLLLPLILLIVIVNELPPVLIFRCFGCEFCSLAVFDSIVEP